MCKTWSKFYCPLCWTRTKLFIQPQRKENLMYLLCPTCHTQDDTGIFDERLFYEIPANWVKI